MALDYCAKVYYALQAVYEDEYPKIQTFSGDAGRHCSPVRADFLCFDLYGLLVLQPRAGGAAAGADIGAG
jgi:hypothetical protein